MNMDVDSIRNLVKKLDNVSSVDCTNDVLSLIADSSDAIRKCASFIQYWSNLYGEGLQVYGWHLNGDPEDFDSFYNSAMECLGF